MTTITIHDLEKETFGPIWAVNKSQGRDKGNVAFTVPKSSGGYTTVNIPLTFIPLDLTEQATKEQILKSTDFRRAVSLGYLALISNEEAEKILNIPGADKERQRIIREQRISSVEEQASALGMISPTNIDDDTLSEGIMPTISLLMAEAADKDQVEIINSLRALESELSVHDLEFVKSRALELNYGKLNKYCKNKLEKRESQ